MPAAPTIWAATLVAYMQVAGRAGRDVAEEQLLGDLAAHRDLDQAGELLAGPGVDVLAVAVREQAERRRGA